MKIAIVGAGLGGLFCAHFLRENGFTVDVFERTSQLKNIGGGIEIWGNGTRCLKEAGFTKQLAAIGSTPSYKVVRNHKGQLLQNSSLEEFYTIVQDPFHALSRTDLHEMLAQSTTNNLHLNHELESYEQKNNNVSLFFKNGMTYTADLLIAADGVNSKIRDSLYSKPVSKYMGLICAGGVIAKDFQKEFPASMEHVVSQGKALVLRTIPGGRAYWYFFMTHPEESFLKIKDKKIFLLESISDWTFPYPEVIDKTPMNDNFFFVQARQMSPLPSWGKERVFLLGDAAHGMSPLLGQNACLAFEDSVVLTKLLQQKFKDFSSLHKKYYETRFPRIERVRAQDTLKCQKLVESLSQNLITEPYEKSFLETMASIKEIILDSPLLAKNP